MEPHLVEKKTYKALRTAFFAKTYDLRFRNMARYGISGPVCGYFLVNSFDPASPPSQETLGSLRWPTWSRRLMDDEEFFQRLFNERSSQSVEVTAGMADGRTEKVKILVWLFNPSSPLSRSVRPALDVHTSAPYEQRLVMDPGSRLWHAPALCSPDQMQRMVRDPTGLSLPEQYAWHVKLEELRREFGPTYEAYRAVQASSNVPGTSGGGSSSAGPSSGPRRSRKGKKREPSQAHSSGGSANAAS